MRILVTEPDLLVIRKAIKLLIKFSPRKINYTEMQGIVVSWMGYIDYKQVRRLVVETPQLLDNSILEALHKHANEWISEENEKDIDSIISIDSLKFSKLSAFSYTPRTLPMIINSQNQSDFPSKRIVFDEFSRYAGDLFKSRGKQYSENITVDAMKFLKLPCFEWWVPDSVSDINAPSVVVLSKLVKLVKPVLDELQKSDSYHFWDEENKAKGIIEIKALYQASMISAVDALSQTDININPFGFKLVKGVSDNGSRVYSFYNANIYAFIPYLWETKESAHETLARMLSTGSVVNPKSSTLSGGVSFEDIGRINISNGCMELNVNNLPNKNIPLHVIKRFDNHELKPISAQLKNCGDDRSRFSFLSMLSITPKKISGWVDQKTLTILSDSVRSFETNLFAAKALLNNPNLNSESLIKAVKQVVTYNLPNECLDIDNPESFKTTFPAISKHFAVNVIDDWHYDCATFSGALRKTCGHINASQSQMLGYMFYQALTGHSCTTEDDRDIGIILAAVAVENGFLDNSVLLKLKNGLEKNLKDLQSAISDLSDITSGLWALKTTTQVITCGSRRFTFMDTRSSGAIPIKVSQSINDFKLDSLEGTIRSINSLTI